MEILTGKSSSYKLSDNKKLEVSVFPKKWITLVSMSVWEDGRFVATAFSNKKYVNPERFLPMKVAEKIAVFLINRQSQKVAGIKLI